ncbi:MAG: phosphodiester glycosidase family protein, partial [Lachnospiraceae bacterium]|nr:phosphodiester glycosidase family protein [Lachnospiraceae bacterium]
LLDILGGCVCAGPSSEKNLSEKIALYANNSKSNILADLVYIPKLYSIPEDALCGYEPCEDKYHELEDPYLIGDAIAGSEHLIKGADLVFDPGVTFATGQRIYYYADDSIFAIVWKEYCNNCYCNFAEVFISDPSQLKRKIAGDTYGYPTQLYASSMAAQANAVVAMNGDFYKFRPLGICVYDRVVYRCEAASLDTCFFDTHGNMIFSYAGELTDKDEAQRFVDENDILFSLAFGPVLIDNGVPKENLNYRIGETMQRYSRSAIGQLGENHYLLMTIGHVYPYKECCTLKGAQDIMLLKGCVNAYTLDGGQTAELIWRDKPYSYVDWGVERTISDIIYFATAVPEDEQ